MRKVLFPLTLVYDFITRVRNKLYDAHIFKPFQFDVLTIGIGNLSVGGTGKSPHIEYLIELLNSEYSVATLSRGYVRKSKGFQLASVEIDTRLIGDEPSMFKLKYPEMPVAVAENRVMGVAELLGEEEDVNLILLDDVFQHRAIHPHIQILLTKFDEPFYNDFVLPAGNLRECRSGAKRADIILVTKCPPNLTNEQKKEIENRIRKYNPNTLVFFSGLAYDQLRNVFNVQSKIDADTEALVFAGIANPAVFFAEVKTRFNTKCFTYSDHYHYKLSDLEFLRKQSSASLWICTEKDAVKLHSFKSWFENAGITLCYLPISVCFANADFDNCLCELLRIKQLQLNQD